MKSIDNIFMIIAIIAVCFAAFNLAITINKIGDFKSLTGYVLDTGTANLTIEAAAVINFTNEVINWGAGHVNETLTSATLTTEGVMNGTDWNNITSGLVLENIGNVNVTLNLTSSNNAASFIGGDTVSPEYQWKFSENETGSCDATINITTYTNVNTDAGGTHACINLGYDTLDTLIIDLRLLIPSNAIGTKGSVITATATAIS